MLRKWVLIFLFSFYEISYLAHHRPQYCLGIIWSYWLNCMRRWSHSSMELYHVTVWNASSVFSLRMGFWLLRHEPCKYVLESRNLSSWSCFWFPILVYPLTERVIVCWKQQMVYWSYAMPDEACKVEVLTTIPLFMRIIRHLLFSTMRIRLHHLDQEYKNRQTRRLYDKKWWSYTVKSWNLSDTSIWNIPPKEGSTVLIFKGHTVTIDTSLTL